MAERVKSEKISEMEVLKESSKRLYQDYKERIIDILLFGSFIKNKLKPEDIDIAVLLKNTKQKELLILREKFASFFEVKVHLNLIMIEDILENALFKALLEEGFSLMNDKPLSERIGYSSGAVFNFNLKKLQNSKKVLFSYALHGKKNENGVLNKTNGKGIGKGVVFIPPQFIDEFKEFLELWNVDYYMMKILKS